MAKATMEAPETASYQYDEAKMLAAIEAYQREQQRERRRLNLEPPKPAKQPVAEKPKREIIAKRAFRESLESWDSLPQRARPVCRFVCDRFMVGLGMLTSICNRTEVCRPRQIAAYLLVRVVGYGMAETARILGGMHHTTVMASCRVVEARAKESRCYARGLSELELAVKAVVSGCGK